MSALILAEATGLSRHGADGVLLAWFALVLVSAAYVAYDAFTRNPELTVMKWGWVLVTLYIGPVGAALYVLSCKEPAPGQHETFVAPLWKQSLGSTIHCVAGDATGIVVAAAVTTSIGAAMWAELIVEYAFGLLVFQAFFMRDMLGGSYRRAVRSTVVAEWLSMNCVMAGMVPVMVLLRTHVAGTTDVGSVRFWAVLSAAVMVGLVTAYPVNVWLVQGGLKHGMGTVRALGAGGSALDLDEERALTVASALNLSVTPGAQADPARPSLGEVPMTDGRAHPGGSEHAGMGTSTSVTRAQIAAIAVLTLVLLFTSVLIAAGFGSLTR